jgi:hypothetical protein
MIRRSVFAALYALPATVALILCGCPAKVKTVETAKSGGHSHPSAGPHGGPLVEWGDEEYHLELLLDRAKKQATVYVLDGDAKKAVPIKSATITMTATSAQPPIAITLKAEPDTGDPPGSSSRFSGQHDILGGTAMLKGEISGKVDGKDFAGDFKEKSVSEKK